MVLVTWASFDDGFAQMAVWDTVSYEGRWHYVCLVTYACKTNRWEGRIPYRHAERVSDVPDPQGCLQELIGAGLLRDLGTECEVTSIDQHVPPEGQRPANLLPRKRRNQVSYRRGKCERGEHSKDCPATCPLKQKASVAGNAAGHQLGNATGNEQSDRRVAGNGGAGRGGAGRETSTTELRLEEGRSEVRKVRAVEPDMTEAERWQFTARGYDR